MIVKPHEKDGNGDDMYKRKGETTEYATVAEDTWLCMLPNELAETKLMGMTGGFGPSVRLINTVSPHQSHFSNPSRCNILP